MAIAFAATARDTAFGRLVDDVMNQEPYHSARRVSWIVDNGSSHRGQRAAEELLARHPRIVIVHTPTYASWLNQIEISDLWTSGSEVGRSKEWVGGEKGPS